MLNKFSVEEPLQDNKEQNCGNTRWIQEAVFNILSENLRHSAEEKSVYKLPQNSQNLKHVQQQ
jgi:hypothetical protein